jgi:hypothetical protein
MTELTIVDIYWTERTRLQYDAQKQTYIPPGNGDMDGNGFYCVYGRHPVYGPDVLLYIGETKETESGRSFRGRLGEHLKGRFWYHANRSVALGTPDCNQKLMPQEIRFVESILVAAHKPALNRVHIDCAMEVLSAFWSGIGTFLTHFSMSVRATTGGSNSIARMADLAQVSTAQHHRAHVWLGEREPRVVTRLDKLARSYAARVSLACSMRFFRHLFSYGAYKPLTCEPKGNNHQQRDHLLYRFGPDSFLEELKKHRPSESRSHIIPTGIPSKLTNKLLIRKNR